MTGTLVGRVRAVLAREPRREPLPADGRRAAVAAVVVGGTDLLFMRRAEAVQDPWSGHLSFPGGRVEPGESPLEAAVRETREELGLDLADAALLGPLDQVGTRGGLPKMVIHPFVFAVDALPELTLNYEVASVHTRSLRALLHDEGRGRMLHPWRAANLVLPRVDFDGVRLWGLTLHMVDDLLDRLDGRGRGLARIDEEARTPWDE